MGGESNLHTLRAGISRLASAFLKRTTFSSVGRIISIPVSREYHRNGRWVYFWKNTHAARALYVNHNSTKTLPGWSEDTVYQSSQTFYRLTSMQWGDQNITRHTSSTYSRVVAVGLYTFRRIRVAF